MNEQEIKVLQEKGLITKDFQIRADNFDSDSGIIKEATFTTAQPAMVIDWKNWRLVNEVLVVKNIESRNNQIPMLDNHARYEGSLSVIGSGRNMEAKGDNYDGELHFSKSSELALKIIPLIEEGHLTDVSLGYRVMDYEDVEVGAAKKIDGVEYRNNGLEIFVGKKKYNVSDALPLMVSKKAQAKEISVTPIGADDAAKIRSMIAGDNNPNILDKGKQEINKQIEIKTNLEKSKMTEEEKKALEEENQRKLEEQEKKHKSEAQLEKERQDEIFAVAEQFKDIPGMENILQKAVEAVQAKTPFKEFNQAMLKQMHENLNKNQQIDSTVADLGLSKKELGDYSLFRALQANAATKDRKGMKDLAPFEMEISEHLEKTFSKVGGESVRAKGFFVPRDYVKRAFPEYLRKEVIERMFDNLNQRVLTVASGAASLVGTDHLASNFIELLRNAMILGRAGVGQLSGLVGNISIPKQSGGATFYDLSSETATVTASDQTFTAVTGSPKTGAAKTIVSRNALIQSDPSVEALIFADLIAVMGIGIDYRGINGTGQSGQPTGIINQSGLGTFDAAAASWTKILAASRDIKEANALIGRQVWLGNPHAEQILKGRGYPDPTPGFLLQDNKIDGDEFMWTNQMPDNGLLKGAFNSALLLLWSMLDMQADPYTGGDSGSLHIRAFQSYDWIVRYAPAFTYADNLS